MGWSVGYDPKHERDIGYGVPARCDCPGCSEEIDRGLDYVCGGEPYGGDLGCGLFFCHSHQQMHPTEDVPVCERCEVGKDPFEPSPDDPRWIHHKLTDPSWAEWRATNPDKTAALRDAVSA